MLRARGRTSASTFANRGHRRWTYDGGSLLFDRLLLSSSTSCALDSLGSSSHVGADRLDRPPCAIEPAHRISLRLRLSSCRTFSCSRKDGLACMEEGAGRERRRVERGLVREVARMERRMEGVGARGRKGCCERSSVSSAPLGLVDDAVERRTKESADGDEQERAGGEHHLARREGRKGVTDRRGLADERRSDDGDETGRVGARRASRRAPRRCAVSERASREEPRAQDNGAHRELDLEAFGVDAWGRRARGSSERRKGARAS